MPAPLLIPLVSLGIKAITTGASYLQERKFKKQAEAAEKKADQALADVNKQIQKDFYSGISLPTEAYERAMEGIMSSTADVVTRAQEADPRGLGSVVGQALQASQAAQRGVATQQAQNLYNLQMVGAQDKAKRAGMSAEVSLMEAMGQQLAQQTSENARVAQAQKTVQGAGELLKEGGEMIPEFFPDAAGRATNKLTRQFNRAGRKGQIGGGATIGEFGNLNPVTLTQPGFDQSLADSYGSNYTDTVNLSSVGYDAPLDFFGGMTPFEQKQYFRNRR